MRKLLPPGCSNALVRQVSTITCCGRRARLRTTMTREVLVGYACNSIICVRLWNGRGCFRPGVAHVDRTICSQLCLDKSRLLSRENDRIIDEMGEVRAGKIAVAVDDLKKSLGKEWGCNLISMAFLVFIVGYVIYWFASGGEPQNQQRFDDCYNRRTREFLPGYEPDFVREQAVAACMREQRRSLGLNPN